jgi:hypothetical protein
MRLQKEQCRALQNLPKEDNRTLHVQAPSRISKIGARGFEKNEN